ncbi:MAG: DeoR/GlpR transcriptional regulator [Chitinophagaceae bacterium]|nr:DeoR/GlpR transcriptional regulator [Chitinophagaceae bacterium]
MFKEERVNLILKELSKKNHVGYDRLAEKLNVSHDTIRRDINYLAQNGLLHKVRGGAIEREQQPLSFEDRVGRFTKEKEIIARKCLQFLKEDSTIFMDGGSTVCIIASYFPKNIKLRVITNNQALLPVVSKYRNIELIALGGMYHEPTATFTGQTTYDQIRRYVADIYFMGICGIDDKRGISAAYVQDCEVKSTMMDSAQSVVALLNDNVVGRREPFKVADIEKVDHIVCNLDSASPVLDPFRKLGPKIW